MEKKKGSALIPKTYIKLQQKLISKRKALNTSETDFFFYANSYTAGRLPRASIRDSHICEELAPLFKQLICRDRRTAKPKGPATFFQCGSRI